MSTDPRTELTRLLDALEAHLSAVIERNGEHDPALFEAYEEVTPLSVYGDDEEDDLEEILDDEDDIDDDDDIEYED